MLQSWAADREDRDKRETESISFLGHIKSLFTAVIGTGEDDDALTPLIQNANSDVMLTQSLSPTSDDGVWTILTGRNQQALNNGMAMIARPEISSRIAGETATINGIDKSVTASVTTQNYIQVREFSLRNIHLIVAGWFSNNHHIYSLLLLISLVGFGLISTRLLKSVGVDRDKVEERANVS